MNKGINKLYITKQKYDHIIQEYWKLNAMRVYRSYTESRYKTSQSYGLGNARGLHRPTRCSTEDFGVNGLQKNPWHYLIWVPNPLV